jgi:hypothetical protein
MENVSSSDYISVKKRKEIANYFQESSSSNYTENKQYIVLQTISSLDNMGEYQNQERFSLGLPSCDLAVLKPHLVKEKRFVPMYVSRRINCDVYIKKKPVKPICWKCPLKRCQICSFCDMCSFCASDHDCTLCDQIRYHENTGLFYMSCESEK